MSTERAYLDDPFTFEFSAEITGQKKLGDGRTGLLLAKTYFYPTGGGQEHDSGTIGSANVIDVFADEAGDVIHVVDRDVNETEAQAIIDQTRRLAFMQHHSGQHLLTQAFQRIGNLETVSAKISIDSPSTIDLQTTQVGDEAIMRAEDWANSIIRQDRVVKSYWITDEQIPTVPFRRPPKVKGHIRVVEIDSLDYSACGGTHCTRTGMIGMVKVLRAERRGDKTRIHFYAGERAFQYLRACHTIVMKIAHEYDTNPEGILGALERQQEFLRTAQRELEDARAANTIAEARRLAESAEPFEGLRLVLASFRDRPAQELRTLASQMQGEPGLVGVLAAFDGSKISLAVACGENVRVSANELIRTQLAEINARGGGDARLAQGGGTTDEEHWRHIFDHSRNFVRELLANGKP